MRITPKRLIGLVSVTSMCFFLFKPLYMADERVYFSALQYDQKLYVAVQHHVTLWKGNRVTWMKLLSESRQTEKIHKSVKIFTVAQDQLYEYEKKDAAFGEFGKLNNEAVIYIFSSGQPQVLKWNNQTKSFKESSYDDRMGEIQLASKYFTDAEYFGAEQLNSAHEGRRPVRIKTQNGTYTLDFKTIEGKGSTQILLFGPGLGNSNTVLIDYKEGTHSITVQEYQHLKSLIEED